MIEVYDAKTQGNLRLSDNFRVGEFACKDGSRPVFIDPALVGILQALRDKGKRPIIITSAYRTPAHNAKVGGAANSQHVYGRAADIQMDGISPRLLASWAEELLGNSGGIGIYDPTESRKGWVHIDTRPVKARWNG